MIDTIIKYFPSLTDRQKVQFETLMRLYPEWNEKINVISRKDICNLEVNHILHSLSIGAFIHFSDGTNVMDLGCGGGFPGIPLAILFPKVNFYLIDRTAKKLKVAEEIAKEADIDNVRFHHGDVSECKEKFDFIVSRAVMPQTELIKIAGKNISTFQRNGIPNGIIALKGGDLSAELKPVIGKSELIDVKQYFPESYFDTKKIVYTIVNK